MSNIITAPEYADWKRDTITKALLADMDMKCKDLMNMWSRAQFVVKANPAASSELNAGALASIEQLNQMMEAIEHGTFLDVAKEEEANV